MRDGHVTATVIPNPDHPAPWSKVDLDLIARLLDEETARVGRRLRVLDPLGGVGRIHDLNADTVHADLEIRWAACRRPSVQANALHPPWRPGTWDAIVTSVVFGNRMSDHHDNRDSHKACAGVGCRGCKDTGVSPRKTYRAANGGPLHQDNAGRMQFGPAYCDLHERIYATWPSLLAAGGMAIVNASNFYRDHKVVTAAEWHMGALARAGLTLTEVYAVPTPRMRHGQNGGDRFPYEHVIVARRP
jgi:hypothetical protein